jgi:hypothetical protein
MVQGTPRANIYPGGLMDATKLYYKSSGAINSGPLLTPTRISSNLAISAGLALTDSSNLLVKMGFQVGQTITMSGWMTSANNCSKVIATVAAGTITFTSTVGLVAESASTNVTVTGPSAGSKHITQAHIRGTAATVANGIGLLCDYLMFYPLFDMDSNEYQETTQGTPTLTLPRYPTGEGVQMFLVTTADLGATPGIIGQVMYTNSLGQDGRISGPFNLTASAIAGHLPYTGVTATFSASPFITLQTGDHGVRSVQGMQLTGGTGAGWACIVLVKPLLHISSRLSAATTERCFMTEVPTMPKVYDEAFLSWLYLAGGNTVAGSLIGGGLQFCWGNT